LDGLNLLLERNINIAELAANSEALREEVQDAIERERRKEALDPDVASEREVKGLQATVEWLQKEGRKPIFIKPGEKSVYGSN